MNEGEVICMTGIVIDYDKRRRAAAVLIDDDSCEEAYKVRVNTTPMIGDEISFEESDIVYHYA